MLNQLFQAVLVLSLSGTVVGIPFVLFKNVLLTRYNGKWYYYMWLFVLLMFVAPIGYGVFGLANDAPAVVYKAQALSAVPGYETAMSSLFQSALKHVIHNQTLRAIWLSGVIISVCYYVFVSVWFMRKIISKSLSITDSSAIGAFQNACRRLSITADIKLRSSHEISSPVLAGLFRPVIVLPIAVLQSDFEELELIISHELTHYKNRDILYKHFILFVKVIHWFNPFVYVVAKTVNEACDYACDHAMTRQRDKQFSRIYANMLLNAMQTSVSSSQPTSYLTANLFSNKKNIKRRFELIMMKNTKQKIGITTVAITAILGVSVYTTVMAAGALDEPEAVSDLNIVITETAKPSDGGLNLSIPLEELSDNGDGSYKYESKDGTFTITFPQDADGTSYTITDGKLESFFVSGTRPDSIVISDIQLEAVKPNTETLPEE